MGHDLVIRGGTVVDGTGAPGRRADVGVRGDRVAEVGAIPPGSGRVELDAGGCVVAPGFVDPHTHLDAQLCWDGSGSPSSAHGVTTVVTGLCGFGVAPCPPGGGDYLLRSLEVVEEIPYASTSAGVAFEWRTFGEYLDHLDGRPLAVNVAAFVPHSALRYAVMGDAARGRAATDGERAGLVAELREALAAGGIGLASSRGPNHLDAYGEPVPSRHADDAELAALVAACRGRVWQVNVATKFATDPGPLVDELTGYARWTAAAGARFTWTPCFAESDGVWRAVLDAHSTLPAPPGTVRPQVCAQPLTTSLRFDGTGIGRAVPGWSAMLAGFADLTAGERRARLADPAARERLRGQAPAGRLGPWYEGWWCSTSPSRPDAVGRPLAGLAAAAGRHPADLLCELAVADDLRTVVQVPVANADLGGVATLAADDRTLLGLGDAGAHVLTVTNYTYPTTLLSDLVRDRGAMPLEQAVRRMTADPCDFLGLPDRGRLVPGAAADVVVVDLDELAPGPLRVVDDLPAGASRLLREASGYRAVVVGGTVTRVDDAPTGETPGRVVRAAASS